ncbi:MAG: helicase-related protein [Armatimonadetes bacterium]|nr:helicase-related protein [Armatimonadota bacterium]MDW8122493.1 helicase-related protein [Armatimonadota bacterium]
MEGSQRPRHARVLIKPFPEPAEVFFHEETAGGQIRLTVVFSDTQKVKRFVFTQQEFAERVQFLPSPWDDFCDNSLPRQSFILFADALRMHLAYTFDPHYAVSVTQVDLLPHQVDAVYHHILPQPRVRFLLADDPGLGKTIMAGLVLKELKARGLVKNVLIIVPAHLQDQWKREMADWFRENFVTLHRSLLNSLYQDDFFTRNPQVLVSLDFARQEDVRQVLSQRRWDLVIVDEAHKFSATRYGQKVYKTKRYQLGEAIAPQSNHLLFLTATPHKGDDDAYFLLLSLLEPKLFANPEQLKASAQEDGLPFVLRRSKEQVTDLEGRQLFRKREVKTVAVALSETEKGLYEAVTAYVRHWYATVSDKTDRRSRNVALALTILQRRLSSSLFAIRESLRRRRQKLQDLLNSWERRSQDNAGLPEWDEETFHDLSEATAGDWESFQEGLEGVTAAQTPEELRDEIDELDSLIKLAQEAEKEGKETKVQQLRRVVEDRLRHHPDEKLLVFTEFKDTLTALERRLREWGFSYVVIHGGMNLTQRIAAERRFRDEAQIMIATDAAGEGINLQFCRLMVNYDLPWNPNRLEQRMGRIHRYGQKRDCFVFNLIYPQTREGAVLERLLEKLERMRERLGDTVYDVLGTLLEGVRLEDLIMQAILHKEPPELKRLLDQELDERLEQFRRALEESALASRHIDLSSVQRNEADSLLRRLVPWDVERFTRLVCQVVGGRLEEDRRQKGVFRISVPQEFLKQHALGGDAYQGGLRIAFQRETARKANAEFFAPGHPLLDALVDHCLQKTRPVRAILVDDGERNGSLWLYIARIQDGRGQPVLERLVACFHDRTTGETREVDPRMVWELEGLPPTANTPDDVPSDLTQAERMVSNFVLENLRFLQDEACKRRERELTIKERCVQQSFHTLIQESQHKLWDYRLRADKGEDMGIAIQQEEENLKALTKERDERLKQLEEERTLTVLEPELQAVALILPRSAVTPETPVQKDEGSLKKQIEDAGLRFVMDYERKEGRQPTDVSKEFRGYDIISVSPTETRYIEVKSFATTGTVEMTAHEWQMAERLGDRYWLYVVENALTEPTLHLIQKPTRLHAEHIVDIVKVVIKQWRETQ